MNDTDDTRSEAGGVARTPLPAFTPIAFTAGASPERPATGETTVVERPPVPATIAVAAAIAVAVAMIAGWTAFFVWTLLDTAFDPRSIPALVAQWAVPVLLLGVVWLLFAPDRLRAARLGRDGRALADQTALLETRLVTINRELSLAREFVAAQSRDLESIGRLAVERLRESGQRIAELVQTNAERIETIGGASRVAVDNMEQLRAQLPVLTSSTRDLANTIGSAGQTSAAQLADVHRALALIDEAGADNTARVEALRGTVDAAIDAFADHADRLASATANRFAELRQHGEEARSRAETDEAQALAALRLRTETLREDGGRIAAAIRDGEAAALDRWREAAARAEGDIGAALVVLDNAERDAFAASHQRLIALSDDAERVDALIDERARTFAKLLDDRRRAVAEADDQAVIVFARRLEELDTELAARQAAQLRQGETLVAQGEAVLARLGQHEARMTAIVAQAREARDEMGSHARDLIGSLADGRETLTGLDGELRALITSGERLRDLLTAAAARTRDELPGMIAGGEARLDALRSVISALQDAIAEADERGDAVSGRLAGAAADLSAKLDAIGERQSHASADAVVHLGHLEAIDERLGAIAETGERLSDRTRDDFAETLAAMVRDMAATGATAFDRALRNAAAETAGRIEQAAAHAAGVSSEAASRLRSDIAAVEQQTIALEARVAAGDARARSALDRDFARRAALITETLNSNAIDIATALAQDLPDTVWAAYLRGDRGVFTRRAVRLLDRGQSRAIRALYDEDAAFRDHIGRYIHDFEAILRELLSARDGQVLAVTMLSSDLGKLYVALAQAIERLR